MLPTVIRSIRTRSSGNGASQRGRRFRRLLMGGAAAIGSIGGTALLAQPASAAARSRSHRPAPTPGTVWAARASRSDTH